MLVKVPAGAATFQFLNGAIGVIAIASAMIDFIPFQFLNGAIGVVFFDEFFDIVDLFQFLNGAIGVVWLGLKILPPLCFNS